MEKEIDFTEATRMFSGRSTLPVNVSVSGERLPSKLGPQTFKQTLTPFADASEVVKNLADTVLRESFALKSMPFREVGLVCFIFADGTGEAMPFTSNLAEHVDSELAFDVIKGMRILDELDEGNLPVLTLHVHGHPGPEFRTTSDACMLISGNDYAAYGQLSAFLSSYAGTEIPVNGIVRAIGESCGDTLAVTTAFPCDPDGSMALRAGIARMQRESDRMPRMR